MPLSEAPDWAWVERASQTCAYGSSVRDALCVHSPAFVADVLHVPPRQLPQAQDCQRAEGESRGVSTTSFAAIALAAGVLAARAFTSTVVTASSPTARVLASFENAIPKF